MSPRTTMVSALLLCGSAMADPTTDLALVVSVSPGGIEVPTWLTDPCPTFSWGSVPAAAGYELAVFWALDDIEATYDAQYTQGEPVLEARITAPALSWTPDAESCLDEGGSYLWFVRAYDETAAGPWSEGRRFEVDLGGGTLVEAVRKEVSQQLAEPDTWKPMVREVLSADPAMALHLPAVGQRVRVTDAGKPTGAIDPGTETAGTSGPHTNAAAMAPKATFTNPSAFRVSSDKGVVFDRPGGPGAGGIPAQGAGSRFMWYPDMSALRAGHVAGSQWDDSNIGEYSVAMGINTTASGSASTAMGDSTTASGYISTAMGYGTEASGTYSTAMGRYTKALSYGETAIGVYNNNTDYTPNDTEYWNADDRLFVIGNGEKTSQRSNALVVLKNGNTGIGTSEPQARLHLLGSENNGSNATLRIQDDDVESLLLDSNEIDVTGDQNLNLQFNSSGHVHLVRGGGNVGIGLAEPTYQLQLSTNSAAKPGSTLWLVASDKALKDIHSEYRRGLDEVSGLTPVRFRYRKDNPRALPSDEEYVGFIAQEVGEGQDGYLDVDMHAVNVAMVNAIKELKIQNEALKALVCQDHPEAAACL